MRVCLLFGVIVSAAVCMLNSRDYDEFHAYMLGFAKGVVRWAAVAVVARAAWRVTQGRPLERPHLRT